MCEPKVPKSPQVPESPQPLRLRSQTSPHRGIRRVTWRGGMADDGGQLTNTVGDGRPHHRTILRAASLMGEICTAHTASWGTSPVHRSGASHACRRHSSRASKSTACWISGDDRGSGNGTSDGHSGRRRRRAQSEIFPCTWWGGGVLAGEVGRSKEVTRMYLRMYI